MRSGSFLKPKPLVAFDCGSQSMSRLLTSAAAMEAAKLMAVLVLPTPPFWLATAIIRAIFLNRESPQSNGTLRRLKASSRYGNQIFEKLLHVEPIRDRILSHWN